MSEYFDALQDIVRRVPLSGIRLPDWDLRQLGALGLSAKADENVWQRVWSAEEKLNFASTPLFIMTISNYVYHNILGRDRQEILLETLRVLKKGGTFALHDIFSKAKYGDMHSFVNKLRAMGYEKVELIDTTNGMFMSPWEAKWMALSGSALLVGKK